MVKQTKDMSYSAPVARIGLFMAIPSDQVETSVTVKGGSQGESSYEKKISNSLWRQT